MKTLFRIPSYIHRVGIELEGGWLRERGIRPYADGSVVINRDTDPDSISDPDDSPAYDPNYSPYRSTPLRVGEICSKPLPQNQVAEWITSNYPNTSNASCGLHVHVSLKSTLRYAQLMDKPFDDYFRANLTAWAAGRIKSQLFWNRLGGQNSFCRKEWNPDAQSRTRTKDSIRYTALNYCYAFGNGKRTRKTLECRVLPMFQSAALAASTVLAYLGIVENYLTARKREKPIELEATVDEPGEPVPWSYENDTPGQNADAQDGIDVRDSPVAGCTCNTCRTYDNLAYDNLYGRG